jgi:hypothetical protein
MEPLAMAHGQSMVDDVEVPAVKYLKRKSFYRFRRRDPSPSPSMVTVAP